MPMNSLYKDYHLQFIPFRLRAERAERARSSFGGEPPAGVLPAQIYPGTRYLGTLGLEDDVDISMFMTFEYSAGGGPFDFYANTRKLHASSDSLLVQFVLHGTRLPRAVSSPLRGELQKLGLAFGPPGTDPPYNGVARPGDVFADHKVGGIPVFDQIEGDVGAAYELLNHGFVHLIQLVFPSNRDSPVAVDWWFNDTSFHVFARRQRDGFDFRYIWG